MRRRPHKDLAEVDVHAAYGVEYVFAPGSAGPAT
jgi:hypothetical protein